METLERKAESKSEQKEQKEQKDDFGEEACPICLESLVSVPLEHVVFTLQCGHTFHFDCIHEWVEKEIKTQGGKATCPLCRGVCDLTQGVLEGDLADRKLENTENKSHDQESQEPQKETSLGMKTEKKRKGEHKCKGPQTCKALTKRRRPCKNLAKFNNDGFCWVHQKPNAPRVRLAANGNIGNNGANALAEQDEKKLRKQHHDNQASFLQIPEMKNLPQIPLPCPYPSFSIHHSRSLPQPSAPRVEDCTSEPQNSSSCPLENRQHSLRYDAHHSNWDEKEQRAIWESIIQPSKPQPKAKLFNGKENHDCCIL